MPEVLVAGAGVAGCAAALAMHRAGATVTVHEAHPTATDDLGAFLILPSSGVQVLAELGVLDEVDRAAEQLSTMHLMSPDGATTLGSRPLATSGPAYRLIPRGMLCKLLQDRISDDGMAIQRGSRIAHARGRFGASVAVDATGGEHAADIVVAADGLRSTLRRVVNPTDPEPRYVGQWAVWGFVPDKTWGTPGSMHMIPTDGSAFGYIPTERGTSWFTRITRAETSHGEPVVADVTEFLNGSLPPLPRDIVSQAPSMIALNSYDLPWVSSWAEHGVLLIGDAAHAASPASGHGAALALEDALVLGKAMRDLPVADAVGAYERARRDRTQAHIIASARMSTGPDTLSDAPQGRALEPEEALRQLRWDEPLPV